MIDAIKQNSTASGLFAAALIAAIVMMGVQGCSIDRLVKHPVPKAMQAENGGEVKVSLADSPFLRERYLFTVQSTVAQFDTAAEDAALFAQILNSAVSLGVQELGTSALPGGTMLVGLLGMLGTLYLPKPGTGAQIQKEKESSYNAGMKKVKELVESKVSS